MLDDGAAAVLDDDALVGLLDEDAIALFALFPQPLQLIETPRVPPFLPPVVTVAAILAFCLVSPREAASFVIAPAKALLTIIVAAAIAPAKTLLTVIVAAAIAPAKTLLTV